ncbi:MAG: M42 family peptidase [Oscillospiraceae bacterium]|nr:M42 family peptidase [Oscillospiraceae bacterium]
MLRDDIETLCGLRGISGQEDEVRDFLLKEIAPYAACTVDAMGNLLVEKKGKKTAEKRVLFSAHMDEVGFIVTHIEEDGLLRIAPVGGISPLVTPGRAVLVGEKAAPGVIGCKPVHLLEKGEKDKPAPLEECRVDMGAANKEEACALASPGDAVTFDASFLRLGGEKFCAKAIDDRAGCAILLDMIRQELPYDCLFSFTVQEETGCAGAKAAAFALRPDIAIAVESTTAADLADVKPGKEVCRQGCGPVLSFMDKGTLYDKELFRFVCERAEKNGLAFQTKQGVFGGNESRSLQTAGGGARVLAVSLPVRYLHSASGVCGWRDAEETRKLLGHMAAWLPGWV